MDFKLNPSDFPVTKSAPRKTPRKTNSENPFDEFAQDFFTDEVIPRKPFSLNQKQLIEVMQLNIENVILCTRILASDVRQSKMDIVSFDIASLKESLGKFENLYREYKEVK